MNLLGIIFLQVVTMFRPQTIASTDNGIISVVESGPHETVVRLHYNSLDEGWGVPACAFLSDEADCHHPLLRTERADGDLVLTFEALPAATRVFDIIGDETHRWMGVHSGAREISFAHVRPKFDEKAKNAHFIDSIIYENGLVKALENDSLRSLLRPRLSLLRDYIVWKWKLSPHEAFILARSHQKYGGATAESGTVENNGVALRATPTRSLDELPTAPKPKKKRGGHKGAKERKADAPPPSAAVLPRKVRPLSRFEQKMLQELKLQNN